MHRKQARGKVLYCKTSRDGPAVGRSTYFSGIHCGLLPPQNVSSSDWPGVAMCGNAAKQDLTPKTPVTPKTPGSCTRQPAPTRCAIELCPSPGMFIFCAAPSPFSGPFPPARPRLRRRRFNELLREAVTLRSTSTSSRGRINPRMVKRRHSPFPSHDPSRLPGKAADFRPTMVAPKPFSSKQKFAIIV